MFDHLLESSLSDQTGFCEEMGIIEIKKRTVFGAVIYHIAVGRGFFFLKKELNLLLLSQT